MNRVCDDCGNHYCSCPGGRDVMADPAVAAIVHREKRDVAERLYNQASHDRDAWREVATELATENARLRAQLAIPAVAAELKAHLEAKENPFAD